MENVWSMRKSFLLFYSEPQKFWGYKFDLKFSFSNSREIYSQLSNSFISEKVAKALFERFS